MTRYDIYEKDGAVYRTPVGPGIRPIADIYTGNGNWSDYKGDRMKPVVFGDHIGQREFPDDPAGPDS